MKIIFLNTWNGKMREAISEFLNEQKQDTDIFCLQEVDSEMKLLCEELLPNYEVVSEYKRIDDTDYFSQSTYMKKGLNVVSSDILFATEMDRGLGIYTQLEVNEQNIHLCNFHGKSRPIDKLDNEGRLKQSQGLIDFFEEKQGLKIIGGDFNILPETQSIGMFEENGYRDLIKDFHVRTTRNRLVWERFPTKMLFSDYVFVNSEIDVTNFTVIENEISDHLPLILEIHI